MVITLEELEREFGRIEARFTNLAPIFRIGGMMGLSEVKQRFNEGKGPDGIPWMPLAHPRVEGGTSPLRNHGILGASYAFESGPNYWKVGTNLKRAKSHHFGATILPKNAKALTIPLTREAVYAGRARNMGKALFVYKTKDKAFLAESKTVSGGPSKLILHWLLLKKAVIPPRPQVGTSPELLARWKRLLVQYLRTGRL